MLISYNWLKSYIPDIPSEEKLADLITFHLCELESFEKVPNGDTVFDLKILPDRAHDLLSHYGVATEIAGLLGIKVNESFPKDSSVSLIKTNLKISIETKACRRYMGRIVKGVKVGPSPEWMVKFLESVGQRSINNIVDATNFVMLDLGQPIHAFDLRKVSHPLALMGTPPQAGGEEIQIVVKNAKEGDKLELVGSEKLKVILKETDMMITDGVENLAIAGVKGGLLSGIADDTTDILIEVANFDPVSVRKTARRLSVFTDASKRYENDLSMTLCDKAMEEISALVKEMCPNASFEEIVDIYPNKQEARKVSFTSSYIVKMLGVDIKDEEIKKILNNYHYEFTHSRDGWEVIIPEMRLDLTMPCDFVEEIGRAYGYDKVKGELPKIDFERKDDETWTRIVLAKDKLIKDGYREVLTYAFTDKGEVEILASASDKNFLRTNLSDGLKESIKLNTLNLPLFDMKEVKVFEVGTIFTKNGSASAESFGEIKEEIHVAYGDKKNVIEMPLDKFFAENISPEVHVLGSTVLQGTSGETSLSRTFKMWSFYPFISRDIAVWIPKGTDKDNLKKIFIEEGTGLLVKEPYLFDSFEKGDKTSYAYRLVFQSYEKTLTDEEINPIMTKIYEKIIFFGWEIR